MKAIIIAAGMGRRLEHHTDHQPKCMVKVAGRSIIEYQLEAFAQNDIHDIHIIRGYLAEKLIVPGATYYLNADYQNNNILHSLFCAHDALNGELLTTYSDIVYTPEVVKAAIDSPYDITLVIDRQWKDAYQGRHDHPVSEAELAEIDGNYVVKVGKQVDETNALGEFIGLAKFSAKGAENLREVFFDVRDKLADDDPFHNASQFKKAYLTDIFMELIDRGINIGWVGIDGNWREVDTVEDLEEVNRSWQITS